MAAITSFEKTRNVLLANEQGTAIITVLLILMLLTFVGITATNTTITEKAVIRSDAIFERDFYLAESAAMEGVQRLDNESTPEELLVSHLVPGVSTNDGLLVNADGNNPDNDLANMDADKDGDLDAADTNTFDTSELDANNETYRLVVQKPIESGDSLALGTSRLYSYTSYGLTESQGGRAMIKVGYKKRF